MYAFALLILSSAAWLIFQKSSPIGKSVSDVASAVTRPIAPLIENSPLMQFGMLSQPTTILFMGTDVVYSDPTRRHAELASCKGNSDTMMLVFLNPLHHTLSVLNIPRDTEANIANYGIRKINSANAIGGPQLAKDTVSSLLGVPIDHYVVMNIQGLVQLVNEVGGVTVAVPKRMSYMDWTGKLKIDLQPGNHTLTGNQAMGFVRFRHDALGDIGRIQRQQIFMQAVVQKMLQPASWLHVAALLDIGQRNIQTDMSNVDIFQTLNFAHSVDHQNVKFVMLPGDFASNGDWIANTDGRTIAQQLADPDREIIRSRRNISVCIINASSDRTLGSQLARALRKLGYMTCVAKDEDEPDSNRTRIIAQNGNIAEANMMMQDLGNIGQVVPASVGNLLTSITIVAHDDIKLDRISMSTPDAPYVAPLTPPQPLVVKAPPVTDTSSATVKTLPADTMLNAAGITPDEQQVPSDTTARDDSRQVGVPGDNASADSADAAMMDPASTQTRTDDGGNATPIQSSMRSQSDTSSGSDGQ